MALSNDHGWIVLTTGNKSEMATGYSTLYGDSAGGFAVIKDVAKTLVYELCRCRNARAGPELIPEARARPSRPRPSCGPTSATTSRCRPTTVLDPVLAGLRGGRPHRRRAGGRGLRPRRVVDRVVRLVDLAEYKRRQTPPGVRISRKAFGRDRRMPITNHYRSGARRTRRTADGATDPSVV